MSPSAFLFSVLMAAGCIIVVSMLMQPAAWDPHGPRLAKAELAREIIKLPVLTVPNSLSAE